MPASQLQAALLNPLQPGAAQPHHRSAGTAFLKVILFPNTARLLPWSFCLGSRPCVPAACSAVCFAVISRVSCSSCLVLLHCSFSLEPPPNSGMFFQVLCLASQKLSSAALWGSPSLWLLAPVLAPLGCSSDPQTWCIRVWPPPPRKLLSLASREWGSLLRYTPFSLKYVCLSPPLSEPATTAGLEHLGPGSEAL